MNETILKDLYTIPSVADKLYLHRHALATAVTPQNYRHQLFMKMFPSIVPRWIVWGFSYIK